MTVGAGAPTFPRMLRSESPLWSAGFTKQWWKGLSLEEREIVLDSWSDDQVEAFFKDWRVWAHDYQLAPTDPNWKMWVLLMGRGTGKTRTAVETVRDLIRAGQSGRVCLLGQGADDVRDVMIEGESGFLATAPSDFRPTWSPSRGVLEWPNGALGYVYSAEDPEALRGPQFDLAWIDEVMAFKAEARKQAESNLRFGLRLGRNPRRIYTTTPKPHKWIRELVKKIEAQETLPNGFLSKGLYITRGSTYENAENLPESFLEDLRDDYEGTRLGKQELYGEILGDTEGALFQTANLDANRILNDPRTTEEAIQLFARTMERVIVAVDPNVKAGQSAHAAGITVHGIRGDIRYLLADRSIRGASPTKWGEEVVKACDDYEADEIVAEVNNGGDLVKTVIYQVAGNMGVPIPRVHNVHASRGKARRAEPVSAAYEQGKVKHVGPASRYDLLETQLCELHENSDPTGEDYDRADSVVWGQTRLARKGRLRTTSAAGPGIMTMADFGG